MRNNIMFVGLLLFFVGCSSVPLHDTVKDAIDSQIAECDFVAAVSGTSGVGGLMASTGINNAKQEAKQQASSLGATHIVWGNINGGMSPSAFGNAYFCPQ